MLRKLLLVAHRYLGLAAFALLIPIGLTGSALVFHDEIDEALYPDLVRVEPEGERVSIDRIVDRVERRFPEQRITRLELPEKPEDPYEVVLRGGRQVYVDAYRGFILGAPGPLGTATGVLFQIHTTLLAGEIGAAIVGAVGVILVVLGATGLLLWFRGWKRVRRRLSIRWSSSATRVNYDTHNAAGFYTALPTILLAFTGAGLVFFSAFSRVAHVATATAEPPAAPTSTYRPDLPPPSLDTLVARASSALPQARPARIDMPQDRDAAYRIRLRHPQELHPIGLSMVYLDRYGGEVLHAESALDVPSARRFTYGFYPLHIGSFGGDLVKIAYVVLGLAPALLALTGFFIWLPRRRIGRRPRRENNAGRRHARPRPRAQRRNA